MFVNARPQLSFKPPHNTRTRHVLNVRKNNRYQLRKKQFNDDYFVKDGLSEAPLREFQTREESDSDEEVQSGVSEIRRFKKYLIKKKSKRGRGGYRRGKSAAGRRPRSGVRS